MYRTPDGIRVLQGAERQLLVESLGMLVDMLMIGDFSTDIQVLDGLTLNQQIATYHAIACALLDENEPPPALTAVIEGAVASVYRLVRDMVWLETDDADRGVAFDFGDLPDGPSWRERLVAAGREMGIEDLPEPDDTDFDEWDLLLAGLEDHVLWDDDWDMADHLDAAPDAASRIKAELGISDDYFVAIPQDPSDAEAQQMLDELSAATRDL